MGGGGAFHNTMGGLYLGTIRCNLERLYYLKLAVIMHVTGAPPSACQY